MKTHRIISSILSWTCALILACFSISFGISTISDEDSDCDGYSNYLELNDGSDPLNSEDGPFTRDWSNLGLYGGQIYHIEIDPSNPDNMFAGAYMGDGLFRSQDGAQTWAAVLTGHEGGRLEGEATFRNTIVRSIQYAPSDLNTVWAIHDIWAEKSIDGGETWTHIYNSRMQGTCTNCSGDSDEGRFCQSLVIDPTDPETVYIGTSGPTGMNTRGAVYKTTDGGATWTKTGFDSSNEFDYRVFDLAIDPIHPEIIWAITYSFGTDGELGSLYRSDDYGVSWDRVFYINTQLTDLKLWPKNPAIVLIASYHGLISNITGNWGYIYGNDPCCTPVRALAFDPQDSDVLYAAVLGWGVVRAEYDQDSGNFIFGQWANLGLDFVTLTVHPTNGNIIFGGESRDGIFKIIYDSASDGFGFTEQNEGINALSIYDIDVIPAAGVNPAYLIAATIRGFVYKIGDGDWTYVSKEGLPSGISRAVAFDPTISDGTAFYVGGDEFVAKTLDRGSSWEFVSDDIPYNKRVYRIAVAPNGSTLYVAAGHYGGGPGGAIYKSTNNGARFYEVLAGEGFDFNTVIIDPSDSDHILAGGGNFYGPPVTGHLYESVNGGNSWTLTGLTDVVVNALLIDPDDPNTIYAGCGSGQTSESPIMKSIDGGVTWQPSYSGMPGRPTRYGVWGSADTDVFMLGHTGSTVKAGYDDRKILHYDGSGWTNKSTGVLDHLNGIWGSSDQDIIAVGQKGVIIHYDGSDWSPMEAENNRTTQQNLKAIWGTNGSERYAVGEGGTILHYDGSSWHTMNSQTDAHLYAVWAHADGSSVYAVGSTGTILRFGGSGWDPMNSGVKAQLSGIWGTPDGTHIYVTGNPEADDQGNIRYTILSSNGTGWIRMDTPIVPPGKGRLHSVWGFSNSNVYAVGDDGVILHYDGTEWITMNSVSSANLYSVWGVSSQSVFAVGGYGTVLHYDGMQWISIDKDAADQPVEGMTYWNSVTDLKFKLDAGGNRNIYAATFNQGIYLSPNQAGSWVNLLAPPYNIYALEVGSIYVASYGVYAFSGIGFIVGEVKDELTRVGLDNARVHTDLGFLAHTNQDGIYVLPLVAGNFNVTGDADGYKPETAYNVPSIKDGNVVNFYLTDPAVYVKINDAEVLADNGTFEGTFGKIIPVEGIYRWSSGNGGGYLNVPYPKGWVRLVIAPENGCRVEEVWINGIPHGQLLEYSFSNLQSNQTIEVLFEEVVSACAGDLDTDGDVDGLDIARYIAGQQNGVTIADLADGIGRSNCLP